MLAKLRAELKSKADPKYNFNMFFKTPIKAYGVRYPILRKIVKEHFPKDIESKKLAELCEELWKSGVHEETVVAVMWAKQGKIATVKLMKHWLDKYASNWAQVDDICLSVLGDLLEKDASLVPEVKTWMTSKNLWTRRASVVSFVYPGRRGLYLQDIFEIAEKLLPDKEDLIQKAVGWTLREAAKKHEKEVYAFILKHKAKMGRTALRYSIERLSKEQKKEAMSK